MQNDFPYKWWALIGLGMLSFTAFLDFTIVSTALPFIQKDLNASVLQLQWITNMFAIATSMFMIAAGRAGDVLGSKKVFYFGFVVFAIAAIGAANSPTIQWLIFFRAIQGFAAAIIATVGVALLPQAFPAEEQNRAIGIFTAFNGAGLALGPFIGGILIALLNWRWVFWINVPIIVIGLIFCSFSLKTPPKIDYKVKIDWLGFILLVVGLGNLIYGIIHGEQYGWALTLTWATILIGIVALTLLIMVELRVEQPLLELTLFKDHHTSLAVLVCITAAVVTFVFMFIDPLYLNIIRLQPAFIVGTTLLFVPVVQVIISVFLSPLVKTFGVFNLLLYGIISTLIASVFHAFFTPTTNILFILLTLALMGYTWGIGNAGTITALTQSVPANKMGNAIGTVFTMWNLFGSIFLALATIIFHWRENAAANSYLTEKNIQLTADQHQQITSMLSDPEQARNLVAQFVDGQGTEILQVFKYSFMSGFHWVAWCSAVLVFIIFLAGLKLRQ